MKRKLMSFYRMHDMQKTKGGLLFLMCFMCMFIAQDSLSAPTSAACDVNFLTQIQNNALLQSERQMITGSVLIRKPDSVLEYSCFDQHSAFIAEDIGPVFSEYSWTFDGHNVHMGDTHLDAAIDDLVLGAVHTYINSNFSHDFLGGSLSGSNNSISSDVSGANNVCDHMYNVYHSAKCEDFATDIAFTNFVGLAGQTPRALPSACGSAHKVTQALIDLAQDKSESVSFDKVNPYLDFMQTKAATGCLSPPIPTGIRIEFKEHDIDIAGHPILVNTYIYDDKVCANPACYFEHNNNANGSDDNCSL